MSKATLSISNKRRVTFSVLVASLAMLSVGFSILKASVANAAPQTFVVNSASNGGDNYLPDGICETTNNGECTLMAAVQQANANGNPSDQDVIEFDIPGGGVHTIYADLANIVITQSVAINGYTQLEAQRNTAAYPEPLNGSIRVEINGYVDGGTPPATIAVLSDNVLIEGLAVFGGAPQQIFTGDYDNITIKGSYLGTDYTGFDSRTANTPSSAISMDSTDNLTIGGPNPEDRNVIYSQNAIKLGDWDLPDGEPGAPKNLVMKGNNIFVGADSVTPLDVSAGDLGLVVHNVDGFIFGGDNLGEGNIIENTNRDGLLVDGGTKNAVVAGNRLVGNGTGGQYSGLALHGVQNTRVGGTGAGSRNVIADNNNQAAVQIYDSQDIDVKGNSIGVNEDPSIIVPNRQYGIELRRTNRVMIGGDTSAEGNIISNSELDNIFVEDSTSVGIRNNEIKNSKWQRGIDIMGSSDDVSILSNSIYNNHDLGIDIDANGVTYNDSLDIDTGPNSRLNFPSLDNILVNGSNTDITYGIDVPAGDYKVEFFSNTVADDSGFGEGEALIGSQSVTSLGSGTQQFTTTIPGSTFANYSATITEVDPDAFYGFGATSEFGGELPPPPPVSDISINKTLTNPQDIVIGATANYQLTYTNIGSENADLSAFNEPLNSGALLYDFVPADLIVNPSNYLADGPFPGIYFIDVGNPDLACIYGGPGAGVGFGFTTDPTLGVVACWLTGPDTTLESGSSITANLNFEVAPDSDLVFTNYVLASPTSTDPQGEAIGYAFSSGDLFSTLVSLNGTVNNFASSSYAPTSDISITKTLTNPQDIAIGATANYQVSLTNNGPSDSDLSDFTNPGGGAGLIYDFIPADLINPSGYIADGPIPGTSFIDVGNPDLACIYAPAPGAAGFGAATDPTIGILVCWLTGSDTTLESGSSINLELNFEVAPDSDLVFTNYVLALPPAGDPDIEGVSNAFSSGDPFAGLVALGSTLNNFAAAPYPLQVEPPEQGSNGSSSVGSGSNSNGGLSNTGQNILMLVVSGVVLVSLAAVIYKKSRKPTPKPKS